jgi:hypothetical protein
MRCYMPCGCCLCIPKTLSELIADKPVCGRRCRPAAPRPRSADCACRETGCETVPCRRTPNEGRTRKSHRGFSPAGPTCRSTARELSKRRTRLDLTQPRIQTTAYGAKQPFVRKQHRVSAGRELRASLSVWNETLGEALSQIPCYPPKTPCSSIYFPC